MTENLTAKANLSKPKVIAIVGATASGKTSYSIELAKNIGGEIISADSRLVYRGFDVTCAKPSLEEQEGIPHHMMDILSPEFEYSGGKYVKDAKKCVYEVLSRGKIPIVVGGTGLYFRLLLENYIMPEVKPDLDLRERLRHMQPDELYETLIGFDSEGAESIEKNDRKKLIRAIEIVTSTGKPLKEVRGVAVENEFDVEWIGKNFTRDILYQRINDRVEIMLENGMIEETKSLLGQYGRIPNLLYTIGYQEIIAYLDGILTLEEAVEKLKQNTRRYAKRQLTWFRKNKAIKWDCYPDTLKK